MRIAHMRPEAVVAAWFLAASIQLALSATAHPAAGLWRSSANACAFLLTAVLCRRVARDYAPASLFRLAWLAFWWDASISTVRWAGLACAHFAPAGWAPGVRLALAEGFTAAALACSLLGMGATWWALRRMGLGFRLWARDYAVLAGLAAALAVSLALRSAVHNPQVLGEAAIVLLFVATAISVTLRRFSRQMGGGPIAASITWLIVYLLLRCVLNVLNALNDGQNLPLEVAARQAQVSMPWAFALASALRVRALADSERQLLRMATAEAAR